MSLEMGIVDFARLLQVLGHSWVQIELQTPSPPLLPLGLVVILGPGRRLKEFRVELL